MVRVYLNIPHVNPKLEVVCKNERIMEYVYNMFTPYVSLHPVVGMDYVRLIFRKMEDGRIVVEGGSSRQTTVSSIIAYIEEFLLVHSNLDEGYIMLHGGGVAYNKKAYLFLANSMVGKSTLISHLTKVGFEYITDDRLVIDTNQLKVQPYTKTIMLRTGGLDILRNMHAYEIKTIPYAHGKIHREFYMPDVRVTENTEIAHIFILIRKSGVAMRVNSLSNESKIAELLKYSLSIKGCNSIKNYIKLNSIKTEFIYYSDLQEVTDYIRRVSS